MEIEATSNKGETKSMFNIDKKKWNNFWYYYKIHVVAAVFIGIFITMTIKDCVSRIEPDITIAYMGTDLQSPHKEQLEQTFASLIRDTNNDGKTQVFISAVMDQRKLFLMVAVREAQILILEKALFQDYAYNGAFQPLDVLIESYHIDVGNYPEIELTPKEEAEKHVYGIPLEGNSLFENSGVQTKEKYLTIFASDSGEKHEDVLAIVEEILKYSSPK